MKQKIAKALNAITCIGASIVVIGAWAKITRQSFGDLLLTIGLLTEAVIFLLYAFLPESATTAQTVQTKDMSVEEYNRSLDAVAAAATSLKR